MPDVPSPETRMASVATPPRPKLGAAKERAFDYGQRLECGYGI